MKRIFRIMCFAIILVIAGCNPAPTAEPGPVILPDTSGTSTPSQVNASAVVLPSQESRLGFVISGLVEELNVAEGDRVQAGQVLAKLDTSELEYDVISAEAALSVANFNAQMARQRSKKFDFRYQVFKFVHVSPPEEKILEADSRVEQSRFALEAAKASVAQGTLVAPFEGTIVEVNISSGEYVQAAQVVIVLVDLENLQIETTDLSELNVAQVEVGQPATVHVEALDKEFPGKVTAISPISETLGGDVVYKVTVKLDKQPEELLWGMSADVEIDTQ